MRRWLPGPDTGSGHRPGSESPGCGQEEWGQRGPHQLCCLGILISEPVPSLLTPAPPPNPQPRLHRQRSLQELPPRPALLSTDFHGDMFLCLPELMRRTFHIYFWDFSAKISPQQGGRLRGLLVGCFVSWFVGW